MEISPFTVSMCDTVVVVALCSQKPIIHGPNFFLFAQALCTMVQHELNVKNLCFKFIEDVIFQIKFKGKSFIFYKEKIIYK